MTKKMVLGRYDCGTFACYIAYAFCSLIVPISLVQIANSLNFPLDAGGKSAGGALQLARSIPMVLAMILCGFLAGRWGKIRTIGFSLLLMGAGIGIAATAPAYGFLFGAVILAGVGEGVIEGLGTPLVQDLHADDEPGRYINFAHSFWSVGIVATVATASFLLSYNVSWRILLFCSSLVAVVASLFFFLPYHGFQHPDQSEVRPWKTVCGHALVLATIPRFWLFFVAMFLAGGGEFCLTFWAASFIQLDYGASPVMGCIGTASFALGMIMGRMGAGFLVHQDKLPHLIIGCTIAGVLLGFLPPLLPANSIGILFLLLFLLGIAAAPLWPSIQSYCVDRVQGDSTMILILLSCAGIPGCGFFTWLMGVAGDLFGLRTSFHLVPACFAGVATLIAWDWHQRSRSWPDPQ